MIFFIKAISIKSLSGLSKAQARLARWSRLVVLAYAVTILGHNIRSFADIGGKKSKYNSMPRHARGNACQLAISALSSGLYSSVYIRAKLSDCAFVDWHLSSNMARAKNLLLEGGAMSELALEHLQ